MYEIDLLKGRGVPVRSNPKDIVILSLLLLSPVIILFSLIGSYVQDNIKLEIVKQSVSKFEKLLADNAQSDTFTRNYETCKKVLTVGMSEIAENIHQNIQWTGLIEDIIGSMPDTLVISSFEIETSSKRVSRPRKDDPQKTMEVSVPYRVINMTVSNGGMGGDDKTVAIFAEKLRLSQYVGRKLQDIQISQFTNSTPQGKNNILYRISCIFKPDE